MQPRGAHEELYALLAASRQRSKNAAKDPEAAKLQVR